MPQIRLATASDRDAILYVNRLSWQEAYKDIFTAEEISKLFKAELKQQGTWLSRRKERLGAYVVVDAGRILGFIGMASLLNETAAEITTFYLLPEVQGKGIGKQLWDTALKHLREAGYTGIWVWVLERAAAVKFYEGRGCIEKERGMYRVGEHEEVTIGYFLELEKEVASNE
jgi:ribosomal protein S18 acetylase RimI-like enzyme